MKLFQTSYNDDFKNTIIKWSAEVEKTGNAALFHIYVPYNKAGAKEQLADARRILKEEAPDISVIGCSATGEILNGDMNDDVIVVSLMLFEDPGTKVRVFPFYKKDIDTEVVKVLSFAKTIPDLKALELLTAAPYQRLEEAGEIIDGLPEEIEIFGGVAVGDEKQRPYVFAGDDECYEDGSAFVLYSGPELHLQLYRMFGWKPIGYPLKVTRSEGAVIYELDGKPAYDVYNHYLQIKKDDSFFYEALEFPLEVRAGDATYIRHAKSVNPDGSIVMSTNVPQGSSVRIAYGDPRSIIESTRQTGLLVRDFAPEVVNIINCMGRKIFWAGRDNVEMEEMSRYFHITGFSALGEVMRYKGTTGLNNLSIVAVAMREGSEKKAIDLDLGKLARESAMPITARLAIFINTITEELMKKNNQLNEMLYRANHDDMTGLLNRGAIERTIYEAGEEPWYLIMFDVDDFKMINDRFGHSEGDRILKHLSRYLAKDIRKIPGAEVGRWGGEEFMIFISADSPDIVKKTALHICEMVKDITYDSNSVTVSVGATGHKPDEPVLKTINRVDTLMYKAKNGGKDQVCSDI